MAGLEKQAAPQPSKSSQKPSSIKPSSNMKTGDEAMPVIFFGLGAVALFVGVKASKKRED